ncbi:hypothetical protein FNU76_14410 [Chitinimonas arctica]|uniref:IPT/TIG domain-containing protein n=1 Tax=Chitinimonas arctica TaxID=2594795 RepID=A0A516SH15_9NEIS|nr:IPT/TIG domain-containing protein [Chitinimonas arctica]QDQ27454.1 hypothetical protein FNU76_14410 [Chitinimonas arctica]
MRRLFRIFLTLLGLVAVLAACGGGGGDSDGGTTTNPTPTVSLTITSLTPTLAAPGSSLSVTGTGFNTVTAVRLGGVAATFTVHSDTSLTVIVPVSAVTGGLQLASGSSTVQSSQLVVVQVPAVTAITPTIVNAGGRITVQGVYLDQVASVRLGTVTLPIVSKSADQLVLDVPANAFSGALVLVGQSGGEWTSVISVAVVQGLSVSAISPAAGIVGSTVTLSGNGLDRVNQVFFGAVAAVPASKQNNQLSVVVPAGAVPSATTAATLRLVTDTEQLITPQTFRVAPRIAVTGMTPNFGLAGQVVTVSGSGFSEVKSASLGGVAVTLGSQSDTQLQFTVPAGAVSGEVLLAAAAPKSQNDVSAGAFVVTSVAPATVGRIDFVQTYSQQANATYQRLLPGKPAVVRAYVVGQSGAASPGVTLVVKNGSTVVASLPMSGPSVLPSSQLPYSLAQTFNATLTASQVASGLNVTVQLSQTATGSLSATPSMGASTNLKLVLVPLQAGLSTGVLPSLGAVRQTLLRTMPLADTAVQITTRGTYQLTSVNAPPQGSADWNSMLDELETLRSNEADNRHYFGFVPNPNLNRSQTVGLGFQNGPGFSRSDSAIGLDSTYAGWQDTFVHEMGHNFTRPHAPCGNPDGVDGSYPYANGALSGTPLYDINTGALSDPAGQTDVMGYCDGSWFSDYNYRAVQTWLEGNGYPRVAGGTVESELLLVSGYIDAKGVHFSPLQARRGQPQLYAGGSHVLRLTLADGSVREHSLRTVPVPDGHSIAFRLAMPYPGPLSRLDIVKDGKLLQQPAAKVAQLQGAAGPAKVDWREVGGELLLSWNATAYPRLSVTHVGSERQVLAAGLTGGSARLPMAGLPAGGKLEFSLGRALDARVLQVKR